MNIKNSLIKYIKNNEDDFISYQTNKLNEKRTRFHYFSCNFLREHNILSKTYSFSLHSAYILKTLIWIYSKKMLSLS